MADRTSAYLFGTLFEMLADGNTPREEIAAKFWKMRTEYDFSDYQMGCDEAILKLGFGRRATQADVDNRIAEAIGCMLYEGYDY
jgi:hypothetical protein